MVVMSEEEKAIEVVEKLSLTLIFGVMLSVILNAFQVFTKPKEKPKEEVGIEVFNDLSSYLNENVEFIIETIINIFDDLSSYLNETVGISVESPINIFDDLSGYLSETIRLEYNQFIQKIRLQSAYKVKAPDRVLMQKQLTYSVKTPDRVLMQKQLTYSVKTPDRVLMQKQLLYSVS